MTTSRISLYDIHELDPPVAPPVCRPEPWELQYVAVLVQREKSKQTHPVGYFIAYRQEPRLDGIDSHYQRIVGTILYQPSKGYHAYMRIDNVYCRIKNDDDKFSFQFLADARLRLKEAVEQNVLSWNHQGR